MPVKEAIKKFPVKEKTLHSFHLIADFLNPENYIENPEELEQVLFEAAYAANNTPLKAIIHKFPEQGITGVILLAESHISIHTWPEHEYVAVDIFSCGRDTQPYRALEYLKGKYLPERVKVREVDRGEL